MQVFQAFAQPAKAALIKLQGRRSLAGDYRGGAWG